MIRRLYVHNFRCLENFELPIAGHSSVLLIGANGAGKTTVGLALEVLQRIARGTNRVGDLVRPKDLTRGRTDVPMRFEIEVTLAKSVYIYSVAFEFPSGFRELRVFEESLTVDGEPVYKRELAQVDLTRVDGVTAAHFRIDWHLVALPIVQRQPFDDDPLNVFRQWLAKALILRPVPSLIRGESEQQTLQPNAYVTDFAAWFSGLVASAPAAYAKMDEYLKGIMPDLVDVKNLPTGKESRSLAVQFSNSHARAILAFDDLSDGEKCFLICALVIATNDAYGPLLCFWDDPDNYLSPSEVGHSVIALRNAFQDNGQLIATSHNAEAIRRFSDENTLVFHRKNHLEPTLVRRLEDIRASGELHGDLIGALIRGDV
jgi:predicted ATPase